MPSAAAPASELILGGITPFTTIDFPGRLAAVFYTQGCAWRCRYCHNEHLRSFRSENAVPFHNVLNFLRNRKGFLDGAVFSGGEPTSQPGLPDAMHQVRSLGFEVALHTAGIYPDRFREALKFCDWVGMDVKAPFASYEKITCVADSGELAKQSLALLLESGVDHEIRTTVHPALLSEPELLEMACQLKGLGVRDYVLQVFRPQGCSDEALKGSAILQDVISEDLKWRLSRMFRSFKVRNG